jgi:hypothetical protein
MRERLSELVQGQADAAMGLLTVAREYSYVDEDAGYVDIMKLSFARQEALDLLDSGASAKRLYEFYNYGFEEYFVRLAGNLLTSGDLTQRDEELVHAYTLDYERYKPIGRDGLSRFERDVLLRICY